MVYSGLFLGIFFAIPLLYYNNINFSHDERFIVDLTFSIPANNFIFPVNYYGPVHSYLLLFVYSILSLFGFILKGNAIEYIKFVYVNNPEIILLLGKFCSYILFLSSLFLFGLIAKIKVWSSKTIFFGMMIFALSPELYKSSTIIKVELLTFFCSVIMIYLYVKYADFNIKKFSFYSGIMTGIIFCSKYNLIILSVFPATVILFKNLKISKKQTLQLLFFYFFISVLTILILLPGLILNFKEFVSDISVIFTALKYGHLNFKGYYGFIENVKGTFSVVNSNIPLIFYFILLFVLRYPKKYFEFLIILFVFLFFIFKWKFKLNHYFIPILPFFYFIFFDIINNVKSKKVLFLILIIFFLYIPYSYKEIKKYLINYIQYDYRKSAKDYVELNIEENKTIVIEDRYFYSPYILPSMMPLEWDYKNIGKRNSLKKKYFDLLIKYGISKKYKLIILNVPLEGSKMETFEFPDLQYLKDNCDYVITNRLYYSRFDKYYMKKSEFEKKAEKFYYEILPVFESIDIERIKIYKIK